MTSSKLGQYIVIEGQDGTGKTTQLNLLADYFREQNREVVIINEGAEIDSGLTATDQIDTILHDKSLDLDPVTNVLLFTAQRRELWIKVAEPTLKRGGVVLSARNWLSTLAYQHFGSHVRRELIERVTGDIMPDRYVQPDLTVILVLSDNERIKRTKNRNDKSPGDAFEGQKDDFQTRVNHGYEQIAKDFSLPIVDASGNINKVFAGIIHCVKSYDLQ